jgi:putative ABC transport system substrate-binding protein
VIEDRWADGHYDRLPQLAAELAARKPAVIVAAGGHAIAAAASAAPNVPVVMQSGTDPVAAGFARSLARPGGMITGTTNVTIDVTEKFLELLLAAAPKVKRVGFLINTSNVNRDMQMKSAHRSLAEQRIDGRFAEADRPEEIEKAIARLAANGAQALVVTGASLFIVERQHIIGLALARRWPVICGNLEFADAGALLVYAANPAFAGQRAAYYVNRILKGAKPGDLPIEQPMKLELVLNQRTAKLLGLTLPKELLVRADRVIE